MIDSRDALFELLPAFVRQRDLLGGGVLRQTLRVIGAQAVALERDLERMYDDMFIETCAPWVIPYIADLLGATLVESGPQGAGARRRAVGRLLAARRKRGAMAALDALAQDVAGWPAEAREVYRRLAVAQHLDHARPERTATVRIGAALALEAMEPWGGSLIGEVRRGAPGDRASPADVAGLGLAVRRTRSFSVTATQAYAIENRENCYSFSVLGNDAPLFDPRLPAPISRLGFEVGAGPADAAARADPEIYGVGKAITIWAEGWPDRHPEAGARAQPIPPEAIIPADLEGWKYRPPKGKVAVDPVLGRIMFPLTQGPARGAAVRVSYNYGFAMELGGGEYPRPPLAMPAHVSRRRVRARETGKPPEGEFAEIADAIADWRAARDAEAAPGNGDEPGLTAFPALVVELAESGVYSGALDIEISHGESIWIVAAPHTRPVLWLSDAEAGAQDALSVRGGKGSRFVMDGVMVAGRGLRFAPLDDGEEESAADGGLCEALLRHCTLVPGWGLTHDCEPLRPNDPSVVLDGARLCLRVERSIVGTIEANLAATGGPPAQIEIADSVIDATSEQRAAIGSADANVAFVRLTIARSTVIGAVAVHAIGLAEDSLFAGLVTVARRQQGCVRYCCLSPESRVPRQHRCQPASARARVREEAGRDSLREQARERMLADVALRIAPHFVSTRYGAPDYVRLAACTPPEIARGAGDGGEMGVYHNLFEPQRLDGLQLRLVDHCPADFAPLVLFAS
ncbi:hypothetical protein WOB59_01110 [Methylocystis sp. IM4]|uniref:hypothetical protein n=1 Tax=Methylocystis sp. IM4 TaxID=3136560 RepID=UPI00311A66A9